MLIFSFIGHALSKLIEKSNYWRQIYKQTRSTFYTSMCFWNVYLRWISKMCSEEKILGRNNKYISLKICWGSHLYETAVSLLFKKRVDVTEDIENCW